MFDTAYWLDIQTKKFAFPKEFLGMIITKHVLKRCLAEADSISDLKLKEEDGHRRIKVLFLKYELKQLAEEELLEALIAETIALAEITADNS